MVKKVLHISKCQKKWAFRKKKFFLFKQNPDYSWNYELIEFYKDISKKRISRPGILEAYENLKIINSIYRKNDNN